MNKIANKEGSTDIETDMSLSPTPNEREKRKRKKTSRLVEEDEVEDKDKDTPPKKTKVQVNKTKLSPKGKQGLKAEPKSPKTAKRNRTSDSRPNSPRSSSPRSPRAVSPRSPRSPRSKSPKAAEPVTSPEPTVPESEETNIGTNDKDKNTQLESDSTAPPKAKKPKKSKVSKKEDGDKNKIKIPKVKKIKSLNTADKVDKPKTKKSKSKGDDKKEQVENNICGKNTSNDAGKEIPVTLAEAVSIEGVPSKEENSEHVTASADDIPEKPKIKSSKKSQVKSPNSKMDKPKKKQKIKSSNSDGLEEKKEKQDGSEEKKVKKKKKSESKNKNGSSEKGDKPKKVKKKSKKTEPAKKDESITEVPKTANVELNGEIDSLDKMIENLSSQPENNDITKVPETKTVATPVSEIPNTILNTESNANSSLAKLDSMVSSISKDTNSIVLSSSGGVTNVGCLLETETSKKSMDVYDMIDEEDELVLPPRPSIGISDNKVGSMSPRSPRIPSRDSSDGGRCEKCGLILPTSAKLAKHVERCVGSGTPQKVEVEELKHKCTECEYASKWKFLLQRHLWTHGIYTCQHCSHTSGSDKDLETHVKEMHPKKPSKQKCNKCLRFIQVSEDYEEHLRTCVGKVPHICSVCNKEFKYKSLLDLHEAKHSDMTYSCDKCEFKTNRKDNLMKHQRNIHEEKKMVTCPQCNKEYTGEVNLKRHLKTHDEGERPFKCEKCSKTFKTESYLKMHEDVQHNSASIPCPMDGCHKVFKSTKTLKHHQQEFHDPDGKKYKCPQEGCDQVFFKRSHMKRHEATHTDERRFKCDWPECGKAFRHADNLKVHYRQHTNEKPFKCEECDFACRQKSSLQWHMKRHHGDQAPPAPKKPKKEKPEKKKKDNKNGTESDKEDSKTVKTTSPVEASEEKADVESKGAKTEEEGIEKSATKKKVKSKKKKKADQPETSEEQGKVKKKTKVKKQVSKPENEENAENEEKKKVTKRSKPKKKKVEEEKEKEKAKEEEEERKQKEIDEAIQGEDSDDTIIANGSHEQAEQPEVPSTAEPAISETDKVNSEECTEDKPTSENAYNHDAVLESPISDEEEEVPEMQLPPRPQDSPTLGAFQASAEETSQASSQEQLHKDLDQHSEPPPDDEQELKDALPDVQDVMDSEMYENQNHIDDLTSEPSMSRSEVSVIMSQSQIRQCDEERMANGQISEYEHIAKTVSDNAQQMLMDDISYRNALSEAERLTRPADGGESDSHSSVPHSIASMVREAIPDVPPPDYPMERQDAPAHRAETFSPQGHHNDMEPQQEQKVYSEANPPPMMSPENNSLDMSRLPPEDTSNLYRSPMDPDPSAERSLYSLERMAGQQEPSADAISRMPSTAAPSSHSISVSRDSHTYSSKEMAPSVSQYPQLPGMMSRETEFHRQMPGMPTLPSRSQDGSLFPPAGDFYGQFIPECNTLPPQSLTDDRYSSSSSQPTLNQRPSSVVPQTQAAGFQMLQSQNDFLRRTAYGSPDLLNPGSQSTQQAAHWIRQDERARHWTQSSPLALTPDLATNSPLAKDPFPPLYEKDYNQQLGKTATSFGVPPPPPRESAADPMSHHLDMASMYMAGRHFNPAAAPNYQRHGGTSAPKPYEDTYRHVPDYRSLSQTTAPTPDMFGRMGMNAPPPPLGLEKYYYPRDPMYRPQHLPTATPPFMSQPTGGQVPTYTDRDYARNAAMYAQANPYSFIGPPPDKQYLTGDRGKLPQTMPTLGGRDYFTSVQAPPPPPNPGQDPAHHFQDPYRRSVIYNMMNRYFE